MSLDDLFDSVKFIGSEDLPRESSGLPVVHDDDEDASKLSHWNANVIPGDDDA
jgi:hypothetical protein